MSENKNCFIVMPLTTPDYLLENYRDGEEHFTHVLNCLFIPAVKKAGYEPIPPKAEGSDLIQVEIIKNIESSDIVLCDMSTLNPNVFFEYGIRTSLNKSVCVLKDDKTKKVPFDISVINYHEYDSSLEAWIINGEIDRISEHLIKSVRRSKGENQLWKHFGIRTKGLPFTTDEMNNDNKIDYLINQIEGIRTKLQYLPDNLHSSSYSTSAPNISQAAFFENKPIQNKYVDVEKTIIADYIRAIASSEQVKIRKISRENDRITVFYSGDLSNTAATSIADTLKSIYNFQVEFFDDQQANNKEI